MPNNSWTTIANIAAAMILPKNRTRQVPDPTLSLIAAWPLSPAATLGSSVRTKGIERELRARLPGGAKKHVKAETGSVTLQMAEEEAKAFRVASDKIAKAIETIEALPVLPREVEDILSVSSRERHKWLRDGRLQSIGTRTVKMRGRSKAVTFHVFDPKHIEEVLDRDLPNIWREEDADEVARNRRRGANKAAATRAGNSSTAASSVGEATGDSRLDGWDAFDKEGLLR